VELHRLESLNLYESKDSLLMTIPRLRNPINVYEFMAVCAGTFPEPFTFSLRAYRRIRQLLSSQKFDIIHDNQCLGYGLLLMKHLRVPVVATIHHPIPIDREMAVAQARNLREKVRLQIWYSFCTMQRLVARRIDRVITVSQSSAEAIERTLKVPRDRLRLVYNGVDVDLFKKDDDVPKMPHSLILVNSGEQSIKGVPYLLKALHTLRNGAEVKLTIIGSPAPNGQNLQFIKEYGLEDIVTFTGRVTMEELIRYYSAAEICVVPSLYEGFGLPAAEAMACRLPVVTTTGGALPEVVGRDGETGILVPPADSDALATAIKHLLDDEHLRRRMGEAGRRRIERSFTWEQAAKKTLEVYQEVL
jgi:glycosyltransferase involved in cell wall biosynthesis